MLTCLRVQNLVIVERLEIEPGPGLTVITGETGAGKSLLVQAIQLVLGGRASAELVRAGADRAVVEAVVEVPLALRASLVERGLASGAELVLRREILPTGRSRALIDDRLVTAETLRSLGQALVDISSQHEYHSLTDVKSHLGYLDAYGDTAEALSAVAEAYGLARAAVDEAARWEARIRERAEREDLLRFQLGEIEKLDPKPGELAGLEVEVKRLRHAESLSRSATQAERLLYVGDQAMVTRLHRLVSELAHSASVDPELVAVVDQIRSAAAELEDAGATLGRYARGLSWSPSRLAELDERREALKRLARRYGGDDEVLSHRESLRSELGDLEDADRSLEQAQGAVSGALSALGEAAARLTAVRLGAADELSQAFVEELASLGMGEARVMVEVGPAEAGLDVGGRRISDQGSDRAEFLIAPNRGEEPRSLARVASGGELSRALLALKRVLSQVDPVSTYLFDEVDVGVGGATASVIGRKLALVAREHQVICITHQPQVAAWGDVHIHVEKRTVGDRTVSAARTLRPEERLAELARMFGGEVVGPAAMEAARELLGQVR